MQSETDRENPASNTNYVLIVSTGKNDLQVLGTDADGRLVVRSTGHGGRRLHGYFIDHADVVTEWNGNKSGSEARRNYYDLKEQCAPSDFVPVEYKGKKEFQPIRHEDRYQLFPAKLSHLVEALKNDSTTIPRAVLVIYTDRPPLAPDATGDPAIRDKKDRAAALSDLRAKKFFEDEPIATGQLLARWLANEFGIAGHDVARHEGPQYTAGKKTCWVNVHKGVTTLEGHDTHGVPPRGVFHDPLTLPIARAVDGAVNDMAVRYAGAVEVILTHTGGMADLKECLNASVRFRFGNRVIESHESELKAVEFDLKRDKAISQTPRRADSLRTRLHVEQRIWEGDYVGALAVASHIAADDVHDTWCHAVRVTHDLFLGLEGNAYARFPAAERIWNLPPMERDIVLAAFRVEAALQHDKGPALIAEGVKGLVTLRDILLTSCLIKRLTRIGIVIDRNSAEVTTGYEHIKTEWKKKGWLDGKLTFSSARMEKLLACLLMQSDKSHTDHPVILLHRAIEQNLNTKNNSLAYYRHLATHSTLSKEQIISCKGVGETKGIWKPRENGQDPACLGTSFLQQEIIENALSVVDLADLHQCYRGLNDALFDAIRQPIALDND